MKSAEITKYISYFLHRECNSKLITITIPLIPPKIITTVDDNGNDNSSNNSNDDNDESFCTKHSSHVSNTWVKYI